MSGHDVGWQCAGIDQRYGGEHAYVAYWMFVVGVDDRLLETWL